MYLAMNGIAGNGEMTLRGIDSAKLVGNSSPVIGSSSNGADERVSERGIQTEI
jgi:hypothetical protein